ncbi:MAG: hypothetical protein LBM98_00880 [Oscillospiraceae bacterium]|nr:hypothetical protein [Oscillospiraceae bacterium]
MPGGQLTSYVLRISRFYVNPGLLRRISLTTYRKCGGGFAMTGAGASPRGTRNTLGLRNVLGLRGELGLRGARAGLKPAPTE